MGMSTAEQDHLDAIIATRQANIARAQAAGKPHIGGDGVEPEGLADPGALAPMSSDTLPAPRINVTARVMPHVGEVPPLVPDDEIAGLKARAAHAGASDELRRVSVDGVSHEFIVRKPTRAEWNEYFDWACVPAKSAAGCWNLIVQCAMWPSHSAVSRAASECPGMIRVIVDEIERWCAGEISQAERVEIDLAQDVSDERLAEVGLTHDDVNPLLVRYPAAKQLRVVSLHTSPERCEEVDEEAVTVIVKRPTRPVYENLLRDWQSANKAAACYDAALACMVWPEAEADRRDVLNDNPGLPWALFSVIMAMGGAGAKTHTGKL